MYRQVEIAYKHRKFQHILWRWNRHEPIDTFNLSMITYGMASSSFIAIRCLQETALQMEKHYPIASKVILRDF